MLIRASGYNTGAQEYLEQGNKSGREFTRDELDHRLVLDGQLSLTRAIYESIPDYGQDRYLTFTLSFKEDEVSPELLKAITAEFKQFMMHAYKAEEFNFYAEAHLPKMKTVIDKRTGDLVERKPHIHIIIPRINLLSGNEANPVGVYQQHEKYFEAIQEHLNQKYGLSSPRENIRADVTDAASVLSRYKGDDFYWKNRAFKQDLVKVVIDRNITTRVGFYELVAEYGETRVRNQGKENEYLSVKLPGDAKGTNLKDTIFGDDFIVRRELKKSPLDPALIRQRLAEWPQRAREIKYVHKATPSFRERYAKATDVERQQLLSDREAKFYQIYGDAHDHSKSSSPRDHQRSPAQARQPDPAAPTYGVQNMPLGDVAIDGQTQSTGVGDGAVLLPRDAHVHVGQSEPGRDSGLRPPVSGGRRGRERTAASERTGRRKSAAAVPATATSAGKGADGVSGPGARPRVTETSIPAYMLNPRRVPTIKDIQARGKRLFEPMKGGDGGLKVVLKGWQPNPVAQTAPPVQSPVKSKRSRRTGEPGASRPYPGFRKTDNPLPPYVRNPRRVPGVADIEQRSRRLFEPLRRSTETPLQVRIGSIKALTRNRSASSVAAYLARQAERNQLKPSAHRALSRINKQYFDLRRAVFSDTRLTRQDKTQLASVLSFERLKAREAIHHPQYHNEVSLMGSAEIRKLITEEKEDPGFSIGGAPSPEPEGIRFRVKRILDNLSRHIDPEVKTERERELNAKDLYTRKARFSQNVHYLDKKTDKTLFVDTGKVIAMRRTGITEAGVAVALQLAKERFGSTLTINGSTEFKKLVIEATAKSGMDIHFTDKAMNESLAARRAELEIEKEGQSIEQPVVDSDMAKAPSSAVATSLEDRIELTVEVGEGGSLIWTAYDKDNGGSAKGIAIGRYGQDTEPAAFTREEAFDKALADLRKAQTDRAAVDQVSSTQDSVRSAAVAESEPSLSTTAEADRQILAPFYADNLVGRDAEWLAEISLTEEDVSGSETAMGLRGGYHAMWLVGADQATPESIEMIKSYLANDAYRGSFKSAMEDLYSQTSSPEEVQLLDDLTGFAVEEVNRIEGRPVSAEQPGRSSEAAPKSASRKVIEGELLAHGAAPYQHDPDKQPSYFVTMKTEAGERTVWGVGLADAMHDTALEAGDRLRLEDHGTEPVTVEVPESDGTVTQKTTYRRAWTAEGLGTAREVANSTAVVTASIPAHESPEEHGPEMA